MHSTPIDTPAGAQRVREQGAGRVICNSYGAVKKYPVIPAKAGIQFQNVVRNIFNYKIFSTPMSPRENGFSQIVMLGLESRLRWNDKKEISGRFKLMVRVLRSDWIPAGACPREGGGGNDERNIFGRFKLMVRVLRSDWIPAGACPRGGGGGNDGGYRRQLCGVGFTYLARNRYSR